ncbi:MAG: molybdopterin-dependent oxidoreductase, partial [Burkholderiales bacterium]
LVQRDGLQRLRYVMRYSRQHSTICSTLADSGWLAGVGVKRGVDAREVAESDLIVVWGTNPVSTQVNLMTHIARARKQRGAALVVIDPYRTGTAEQADMHLAVRPGTDAALACAVMHVLFREGYADRDYLARYTDAPAELEAHVATRTPEWAARITGLGADEIVAFARLYGKTRRSYIRIGFGFSRSRNGAASVHAATCLPAVTGAWRHPGGGALYSNGALYPLDMTLIEGLDALDRSTRVLDQSRIGPILAGDKRDLGDGPPVKALFIQNTNPMVVCPESAEVREGFARDDLFVCVHEQFLTDTAKMADIVLPATQFLEHDDIYQASGHTRIQIARKLFEPYAECRTNHDVICALARRLGADHPGFAMTEWQLIDGLLARSGWPDAETIWRAGGFDAMPDYATSHHLNGFPTPSGKFQFKADWAKFGPDHARMPKLPDHFAIIDEAD